MFLRGLLFLGFVGLLGVVGLLGDPLGAMFSFSWKP